MKILKKANIFLLVTSMLVGGIFILNKNKSYAETDYIKDLQEGETYNYDLDGDGDQDAVKIYELNGNLLLKVNTKITTLLTDYNEENSNFEAQIYDFNKNDNTLEIVVYWSSDVNDEWGTKILKFKNNTCKINRTYPYATLSSFDSNNGMVSFEEYDKGRYNKFFNVLGSFNCYDRVRVDGYKVYTQYIANLSDEVMQNRYIANKEIPVYKYKTSTKPLFTLAKGSEVYMISLYQKADSRYIKVKDNQENSGYIKLDNDLDCSLSDEGYPNNLLFSENSCLWWE